MSAANESEKAPEPAAEAPAAAPEAAEEKKDMMAGIKNFTGSTLTKVKTLPRRMQLVLVVVIIVILALILAALSFGGGDDKPEGPKTLDITKLEEYSPDIPQISDYLAEGSTASPNSMPYSLADYLGDLNNSVYFIEEVTATLTWTDEPDEMHWGRMRYNDPDNFQIVISAGTNMTTASAVTPNDAGSKQGNIAPITLSSNETWFVIGNSSDLNLPDGLITDIPVVIVNLYEAEDLYADGPAAFKWNDFGNDYTLRITIKGRVYTPTAE